MTGLNLLIVLAAAVGAGLIGYLTGLASLVSYPVLLAVGLPPVSANVTNTLGMVTTGLGSTLRGAGRYMGGTPRRAVVVQAVVAAAGGLVGGLLLLAGGDGAFVRVVPHLVLLAAVLLLAGPRIKRLRSGGAWPARVYAALLFCVCVYGGYFGAGAGVIFLALTSLGTSMSFGKAVWFKTTLLSVSNLAAGLCFIPSGRVDWAAAVALAIGFFLGGWLGPVVQRFIPEKALRWGIGFCGIGLAGYLRWSA
ncbi:sulfite exporter TauE/SafE family protein [uncultured Propionibacterium sp.]|uniref:sulfite exporter TauE/SafE family protein n=1 Tax=uncultured Propionibacterium sp. TaxID=218066 RepID=UPI002931A1EB|nr:sulfite exporter TauE/SafE family protein [uncultured Propionibacterium sp.]